MRCFVSFAVIVACVSCAGVERSDTGADVEFVFERRPLGIDASFRGLAVASDGAVWVSGSEGVVLRSVDGGNTFEFVPVPAATSLDFRDVHAFDRDTALVVSAGSPGVIYRTEDAGATWEEVFRDDRPEVFLDAMDFLDTRRGFAFGDPIDGRFCLVATADAGRTWRESAPEARPVALPGEAGFAASGTCMIAARGHLMIGTGGHLEDRRDEHSRLLVSRDGGSSWADARVPIPRSPGAGVFSLCRLDDGRIVAVGGDYLAPDECAGNNAFSDDDGATWRVAASPPGGYRSVVIKQDAGEGELLFAAGINGLDVSLDRAKSWRRIAGEEINVLAAAPEGGRVYAAGPRGSVWVIHHGVILE